MKLLNIISVIVICNTSFLYSQFYTEKEISTKIIEFMRYSDETAKFDSLYGKNQDFYTDDELEKIVKIYYQAINEDPLGYSLHLHKKHKEWKNKIAKSNYTIREFKPAKKIKFLKDKIAKKYGSNFINIISIPSIIIANVISIDKTVYESIEAGKEKQINIKLQIEDVIKGEKYFKQGDKIILSYLQWWLEHSSKEFEIGKSYMILLRPWLSLNEYRGEITLHGLPDKNFGFYIIQNNHLIMPNDYFQAGEIIHLNSFKEYFVNKFNIMR